MAESGGRRVWFVAANVLGSEAGVIVGEPSHVGGVVQRFVSRETEEGGRVKHELSVLLVTNDDASRVETMAW